MKKVVFTGLVGAAALAAVAVWAGSVEETPAFTVLGEPVDAALIDAEIVAILAYIKSTWPERERAFQAEVTANDEGGS